MSERGWGRGRRHQDTPAAPVDFKAPVVEPEPIAQPEPKAAATPKTPVAAKATEGTTNTTTKSEPADAAQSTEGDDKNMTATITEPQAAKATEAKDTKAAETAKQAEAKRAARPLINVGTPIVRKSSRTDFTTRATPTDSNPVFLAVKNAALDEPTDVLVENDSKKVEGAISILRRAGAKLNVGMHIAPKPYPTEEVDGKTYVVLTFKTSAERQVRGTKPTEVAADAS